MKKDGAMKWVSSKKYFFKKILSVQGFAIAIFSLVFLILPILVTMPNGEPIPWLEPPFCLGLVADIVIGLWAVKVTIYHLRHPRFFIECKWCKSFYGVEIMKRIEIFLKEHTIKYGSCPAIAE